jgi:hypothetical protein
MNMRKEKEIDENIKGGGGGLYVNDSEMFMLP